MRIARFQCLVVAAFLTLPPPSSTSTLELARKQPAVGDKIATLKRLLDTSPQDPSASRARENLITLLMGSNRFEEALQLYRRSSAETTEPTPAQSAGAGDAIDFKLLDLYLKTGQYTNVLRSTVAAAGPVRDFLRDLKLLEIRVQALLARGLYGLARQSVEEWISTYQSEGPEGSRFERDVTSMQHLRRHLMTLERLQGPRGKGLFTAAVPDSLQHWSRRPDVPIYFFKLVPAHPAGQPPQQLLPGRHEGDIFFQEIVDSLNRGFRYLSSNLFSVNYQGVYTLYVKDGDIDPEITGGHVLTSRVYVHTIPELYKLAGNAFVILVDYRRGAEDEAAYMGDGLIHLSASKLGTMVIMHEILHGLGATHRDWSYLESQGYRFDPEDRGLMTFERGELKDLGLEEKNRALLGWPQVSVVRMGAHDVAEAGTPKGPAISASLFTNLPLN